MPLKNKEAFNEYRRAWRKTKRGVTLKDQGLKQCTHCLQIMARDSFPIRLRKAKQSIIEHCHTCVKIVHRTSSLKKLYSLTDAEYKAMLAQQESKCAICNKESDKILHIDHCHSTGKIRGLLCHPCNTAIGLLKEDKNALLRAINYLLNK